MSEKPYHIHGEKRQSRWLITCDHATNRVPEWVNGGDLGLPPEDMERHIAFDPGALGVTLALADRLDSPAVSSDFSRLVIDPNRGADDPTVLMKLYDGSVIPANRAAFAEEKARRMERLWHPYHNALETLAARRPDSVICAVHSFTRQLRGRPPRPWQVGILYSYDERLTRPLIDLLRQDAALASWVEDTFGERWCVGENEPYGGHLDGDSIDTHALQHGRLNVLVEIRNDLIRTPEQQQAWAERLAPLLDRALAIADGV
ncbi:N-formylglutamate amidohydrolase [Marivivens marinus]|uniref:N-formylglutamate amidohydrolase n=1 Tax=Marivivens marinus TaxID=3110173 RepID=UPI003B847C9F